MADDLSLKAKGLLATQHHKLLFDEASVANVSRILEEILNWCDDLEFQPGKWLKSNKTYRFDRDYITQINQILVDEGYANIFDNFDQDNHRSAAQRSPNEKQAKRKPTHHLILCAVTEGAALDAINQCFYSCQHQQTNIELDVSQVRLNAFDCLVIVENRDSFNDWFEYKHYANLSKPLVIYRGDKYHSTACKTILRSWLNTQDDKPAIYFGDFDLAGLRIATSAGYSHLLLPEYTWLTKNVIKQHYPDNQQKYLARLELDCPIGWQPLLQLMRNKRTGLRQQKMYDTPLILYSNLG
ncbi:DUF7281 domain-containing protein [Paraglaciecola arctica]|uniref:DUF7281 domain-containing protein n=1 Tax=Paraglaciecola arctica BSs20135 TaxID=493475 RepID=K6YK14_9ALTE|nr:hypothetical protein [Paraglaciecola arctica]GAC18527.1 hypothetical protein GARC_1555 [Paraglaciecola arctica BSs20135]